MALLIVYYDTVCKFISSPFLALQSCQPWLEHLLSERNERVINRASLFLTVIAVGSTMSTTLEAQCLQRLAQKERC